MSSKDTPSLFEQEMQGVKRLKTDRVDLSATRRRNRSLDKSLAIRREAAVTVSLAGNSSLGVSDYFVESLGAEDEIFFAVPDLPRRRVQDLQKGLVAWQEGLDLHGLLLEEAKLELVNFIKASQREGYSCVLVVHGKAAQKKDNTPSIKAHTAEWLRQMPQVLAVSSAQPRHGGRGAVYVLLRKLKPHKSQLGY